MCKTRFDSQGMILNSFLQKTIFEKNGNGTRDPPLPPSLQMPLKISIFNPSLLLQLLLFEKVKVKNDKILTKAS